MEPVAGRSEFGFGGYLSLKFIPQRAKICGLIFGQKTEYPFSGLGLAFMLIDHQLRVVGEGIARIDLNQIVNQDHFEHPQHIQGLVDGMFSQSHHHEGEVPGVLGVVLGPPALRQDGLPIDFLQFVRFD